MKLVAFESVDSGRKFLACAEKVSPTFIVTNHLLDLIQTLSLCYVNMDVIKRENIRCSSSSGATMIRTSGPLDLRSDGI